jgi:hypothetical protein
MPTPNRNAFAPNLKEDAMRYVSHIATALAMLVALFAVTMPASAGVIGPDRDEFRCEGPDCC